ncbi:MAG TPA: AAA family ATPase, partial [Phycisphaerae bacterium]|nr:AAA family ATPase [Phycisphaerae bacterium]
MYCSHFELHRPPFNNTPDPTFYFGTPEHEEALATLQYATFQRKGFVLVTGEVGAGKTLVGRMFLRQVDRSASVAAITHTNLTGHQLLAAICAEFELEVSPDATNLQLTERLQNFLLEQFARDRYAVVLVDEAQNLPDEAFEELRMLGNLEADDAKLLQVCILGQPELRERFRQPGLRQIDQRLFRRFHLPALNRVNTEAYIRHRLKVAGCIRSDLFAPEAIERLFSASQGVPRLINKICDNALLTAYGANAARVTAEMVEQSIEPELLPEPTAANETTADVVQPEAPKADPAVVPAAPADAPSAAPGEATPKPSAAQPRVAPRVPARVSQPQLRMLTSRLAETWKSVRQRMDQCRQDLQGELDEAIGQYQSLRSQFREMAPRVASQEEVGELRRLHQSYSDKIVADIARQGQEFRNLMQEAEQRWKDALAHVQVARLDGGSQEGLDILQQEFDEKAYELLARLDCHRQHISQLAEVLQGHCEQTRGELQAIRDAQAEAEGRLAAETARRVEEAREALTARMAGHEE